GADRPGRQRLRPGEGMVDRARPPDLPGRVRRLRPCRHGGPDAVDLHRGTRRGGAWLRLGVLAVLQRLHRLRLREAGLGAADPARAAAGIAGPGAVTATPAPSRPGRQRPRLPAGPTSAVGPFKSLRRTRTQPA